MLPRLWHTLVLCAILLNGCQSTYKPPFELAASGVEFITIENEPGPFCGRCDVVKVTASSDGRAWIERGYWAGNYSNWRTLRQSIPISGTQFAAFRDHLRPYRAEGMSIFGDQEACGTFWHDVDGARVQWRGGGSDGSFIFNFGCSPATNAGIISSLKSALDKLDLPKLNMPWGQWAMSSPAN